MRCENATLGLNGLRLVYKNKKKVLSRSTLELMKCKQQKEHIFRRIYMRFLQTLFSNLSGFHFWQTDAYSLKTNECIALPIKHRNSKRAPPLK